MDNTAINYRDIPFIRKAGIEALKKELGSVGAVYFLRQFGAGHGNYTQERDALQASDTLDDVVRGIKEMDAKWREKNNQA